MKLIKYQRGGRCPDTAGMFLTIEKKKKPTQRNDLSREHNEEWKEVRIREDWISKMMSFTPQENVNYKDFLFVLCFCFLVLCFFVWKARTFLYVSSLASWKPRIQSNTCPQCGEPKLRIFKQESCRWLVELPNWWLSVSITRKLFCGYFHGTWNKVEKKKNKKLCLHLAEFQVL